MRVFFALPVPSEARERIATAAARLREALAVASPAARLAWVAPENYHFTLKFLGSVEAPRVEEIRAAAERAIAGIAPFELGVRGLGAFPPAGKAMVLWAGADDPRGGTPRLVEALETAMAPLGFEREARSYVPHLTIARVKQGNPDRRALVLAPTQQEFGRFEAGAISLMESRTLAEGPAYAEIARLALAAARRP